MAIVEYILDKANGDDEVLVFRTSGFGFSASFIRNNDLQQKRSLKILRNEDNEYWLGFKFFDETGVPNSLALLNSQGNTGKTTAARSVKAAQLYAKSAVLRKIRDSVSKQSRSFPIKWDMTNRIFYAELRPAFEHTCSYDERNQIPADLRGIYRYRNSADEVIYIGKGVVRERASSPERKTWQIAFIDYSACSNEDDAYRWESYYIDAFEKLAGRIPLFNEIKGRSE